MKLTKQQIEEIEANLGNYWSHEPIKNLLETVKDLQAREQRARELLKRAKLYIDIFEGHEDCGCDACKYLEETWKEIKEHLK